MSHLSRDERLLALDGALDGTRQAHLAGCPACRTDVETLGGVLARVRAVDVPEPSPLFWDHLAARVGDAIAREPAPVPDRGWWSPRLAWAAAAVVIAAAGAGYLARSPPQPATAVVGARPAGRRGSGRPRAGRRTFADAAAVHRRRRLGAHRGGRRPGRGRRGLRAAGRAGRAVDLGAVRRRAPGAGGRAGRRTGAGPEPGRMTGIMWGRTFTQAAALGGAVLVVVLAGADAGRRAAAPPAGRGRRAGRPDRHRDRPRTRTSIRPSSGGCSMPTR